MLTNVDQLLLRDSSSNAEKIAQRYSLLLKAQQKAAAKQNALLTYYY